MVGLSPLQTIKVTVSPLLLAMSDNTVVADLFASIWNKLEQHPLGLSVHYCTTKRHKNKLQEHFQKVHKRILG